MAAYSFNVTSGDWNVSTNWSPNGVPGASDDVTISGAARTVNIPSGYTAQALSITFSGTDTSNRGKIEIRGKLELYGNATQGTWTTLHLIDNGELDVRGFNWYVNYTDGTGKRAEVLSSGTGLRKIYSSTTLGGFTGASGGTGYGTLDLQNCWVSNVHFRYGSSWYPGNNFKLINVLFYNIGLFQHDTYIDDAADWVVQNVSFIGTQESGNYKAYLYCHDKGGTITGQRILENLVYDYSGTTGAIIRMQYLPNALSINGVYIYRAYLEGLTMGNAVTFNKFFSVPDSTTVGEGGMKLRDSYFFMDKDNPHTLQNLCNDVADCVVEAVYPGGATDAGDHFIVATTGTYVIENNLIIDGRGGVCLNALNSTFNGSYTFRHNTYVADVVDPIYGQLCRTENFGIFSTGATLNINSNIAYARSNPSAAANVIVVNIEQSGDDQIDLMDNNCVFGMGSTLTTLFTGVTSATKGSYGSQAGWGANDLIGTDPQFVDDERGLLAWGDSLGESTQDATIKRLIYGVNGYNSTTHEQTGTSTVDIDDLLDYVRAGFAPQNVALEDAGYDNVTIGAFEIVVTGVDGSLNKTQDSNTVSASGSLSIDASASITEASDTVSSSGTISIAAASSITEADDTVSSTGALSVSGSSSISEANDTVSSGAALSIDASASVTEQADTLSASGTIAAPGSITGELAVTEQSDTVSSAGALSIVASAAISEATDSVSAAGTLSAVGVASITEASDQLSSAGVLSIVGALTKTEANDTLRSTNVVPTPTDNVYTIQVMTPRNAVSIQSTVKTIKARRI